MSTLKLLTETFSYYLYNSAFANKVKSYLDKRLTENIQKKFEFGYCPNQNQISQLFSFIPEKDLLDVNFLYYASDKIIDEDYRLSINNETKTFNKLTPHLFLEKHNLVMPYKDVYGNYIALVGRTILSDYKSFEISKYKNTIFNKSMHLFGLYEAKQSILDNNSVIVVEGQFDCIKAHEKNISNIVAIGSANLSMNQFFLLLRYTKNIYLLLDNDEAGESGRKKIKSQFSQFANIKDIYLPSIYKDLDEYLQENEYISY